MRLVLIGAGVIGLSAAAAAHADGVVSKIVAVVDPDDAARLQASEQLACPGLRSVTDLQPAEEGDCAIVAISPRASVTGQEVIRLLAAGYDVVTTCEELAEPDDHLRAGISQSAESDGGVVVATGANPGFVMDRLPVVVASAARNAHAVTVSRVVDTSRRRAALVAKSGRGLSPEEFAQCVAEGTVGHAGLDESARLIADGLGWTGGRLGESIEPIVRDGVVTGLHQHAKLRCDEERVVNLDLVMDWRAGDPADRIVVDGSPPLAVTVEGGFHGDHGTTAQVVQALRWIPALEPGFYRPTDLPVRVGR